MTSPSFITSAKEASNVTTCTVPVPGSPQVDDMIVCLFVRNSLTSISGVLCNTSKTFNQLQGLVGPPSGATFKTDIWWRRCDGGESGTISSTISPGTSQRQVNASLLIRGVDWSVNSGVPIACGSASSGSSTTNLDPPSCNMPGGVNQDFLAIAHCNDIGPAFTGTPTGYTGRITTGNLTQTGLNHVVYTKAGSGTSEDPSAFTAASTTSFISNTILIAGALNILQGSQIIMF